MIGRMDLQRTCNDLALPLRNELPIRSCFKFLQEDFISPRSCLSKRTYEKRKYKKCCGKSPDFHGSGDYHHRTSIASTEFEGLLSAESFDGEGDSLLRASPGQNEAFSWDVSIEAILHH